MLRRNISYSKLPHLCILRLVLPQGIPRSQYNQHKTRDAANCASNNCPGIIRPRPPSIRITCARSIQGCICGGLCL